MDHAVVQRWLRQVLTPYSDPQRTYVDVDAALIALSSLSPKTEPFTYNDGRTQLLITLSGTIPVNYRGATYNIPVAYWMPKEYPSQPPLAFVVPTPDMLVRKGVNVDPSGEIRGPYLARWAAKPEACNLLDLIRDCQHMFGQEPPVYARPKAHPSANAAGDPSARASPSPSSNAAAQIGSEGSFQRTQHSSDARDRPPPPAPGQPANGPGQAAAGGGRSATGPPPHRPSKPSQSPEALVSEDPRYASYANGNGDRNSLPYGQQAGPPPSYFASPQRSVSNDYSKEAQLNAASRNRCQQEPARSTSLHSSTGSLQIFSSSQEQGPVGCSVQQRQSWDGRSHLSYQQPAQPPFKHQQQQQPHPSQQQQRGGPPLPQSPDTMRGAQPYHLQSHSQSDRKPPYLKCGAQSIASYTAFSQQQQQPYLQEQRQGQQPLRQAPYHGGGPPQDPQRQQQPQLQSSAASQSLPPQILPPKRRQANLMDALDEDGNSGTGASAAAAGSASQTPAAGPPPPRPPNPELLAMHDRLLSKIDSRLAALSASLEQSNQHLQVLSSDLDRGRPAIEDEMRRLEAVRDVCRITGDRLEATTTEAQKRIETLRNKEDPDVDGMVLATSIVGNQLVDLVAEDNAIEDAMYQLGRALNAERIELDRFLKQTRMLAREQLMKRALVHKIVEGMNWQS